MSAPSTMDNPNATQKVSFGFTMCDYRLTRIRSATPTESERQSKWKWFNHGNRGPAAGRRSLDRLVRWLAWLLPCVEHKTWPQVQRHKRETATTKHLTGDASEGRTGRRD